MNEKITGDLSSLNPADAQYATRFVELVLAASRDRGASDLHLQPTPEGLSLRWRVDGVLAELGTFPSGVTANVIARLKVLADLLTYRNDVPQEGRIRTDDTDVELRVSTFPTLHGERAVVRLFSSKLRYRDLSELQLPDEILARCANCLLETSGAILVTGPAGSGKTTTLYACLHELVRASSGARSIVTLEDPIEVAVSGVTQSQINASAGFDLAAGLRSVLRQDPEVIMIGEIRDAITAEVGAASLADRPANPQFISRRQRRRSDRPIAGYGHRAVHASQRSVGRHIPASRAQALRLLAACSWPRRTTRLARSRGSRGRRMLQLRRHRLSRQDPLGRNAPDRQGHVGAGDCLSKRRRHARGIGPASRDGRPLATGRPGHRERSHQSGGSAAGTRLFQKPVG